MSNQQQQYTRPKTILNDYRGSHPMMAKPAEGAKYPGQLIWELSTKGRVILKSDDKVRTEGSGYTKKEVEMDFANRNTFFEILLDAANNPDFTKGQFTVKKHGFVRGNNGNQRSEHPMKQVELTIIRDSEGVISVGFTKGDYKQLYRFERPIFAEYKVFKNGEWVDGKAEMSQAFVRAYVRDIRPILNKYEIDNFVPAQSAANNNGGNGSYGNNNQGYNSQKNTPPEDFDDDIQF